MYAHTDGNAPYANGTYVTSASLRSTRGLRLPCSCAEGERCCLRRPAGPTRLFVPDHTRDAAFQLWCDLRTNVPKDQKWATRRLAAFKPRTFLGWIVRTHCFPDPHAGRLQL